MKITDIYKQYPVPTLLQQHLIRTASMGAYLSDKFKSYTKINRTLIIKSLLLHDIGNIIKFDLNNENYFFDDEYKNIEYWEQQQQSYKERYKNSEHLATYEIVKELGQNDVCEVLAQTGSIKLLEVLLSSDYNLKIVTYADLRCAPFSVVTVNERFKDLVIRYKGRDHELSNLKELELKRKRVLELEKELQKEIAVVLDKIKEEDIKDYGKQVTDLEI